MSIYILQSICMFECVWTSECIWVFTFGLEATLSKMFYIIWTMECTPGRWSMERRSFVLGSYLGVRGCLDDIICLDGTV